MSKMDQLRALREAKYAQATTQQRPRAAAPTAPVRPPVAPARSASTPAAADNADNVADPGEALCGHRSMNGRTCTREHGHAAKSHRYS